MVFMSVLMIKIKTSAPDCYFLKTHPGAIIKHRVVLKGEKGIKAIVSIKTPKYENIEVVDEHKCELALSILDAGAIISSAEVFEKEIVWNLVCKDNDVFSKLIENLEKLNVEYEIVYKTKLDKKSKLDEITYNEYMILKLALEKGFFESPKRVKLEELAKIIGVSKSTASETLRRGIKKVVMKYFRI